MMEMIGATSTAADAALMASAPRRRPRFLVFHCDVSMLGALGVAMGSDGGVGRGGGFTASSGRCRGDAPRVSSPSNPPFFILEPVARLASRALS